MSMPHEHDEWSAAVRDMSEMDRAATENDHWRFKGMIGPDWYDRYDY